MGNTVSIIQSNYIPWKGYFDMINSVDRFYFCDSFQYTIGDWRNRNKIKTSHGPKWLTIPVRSRHHRQSRIDEITVLDNHWRKEHWKSLHYNYARTPYFKLYSEKFEAFYLETDEQYLSRINKALIRMICEILKIETPLLEAPEISNSGGKTDRVIKMLEHVNADSSLFGPNVRNYLDLDMFRKSGLKDLWMDYSDYPVYVQRFPPFEHQVSILDLIFNTGPQARNYMKSFRSDLRNSFIQSQ